LAILVKKITINKKKKKKSIKSFLNLPYSIKNKFIKEHIKITKNKIVKSIRKKESIRRIEVVKIVFNKYISKIFIFFICIMFDTYLFEKGKEKITSKHVDKKYIFKISII